MADPADLQAAADRLASAVGQSVLIEDLDQHPVWWSTKGAVDRTRTRTILDRRVDPQAAAVVRRFRLAQATAPVRTPAMPEADMWARWCMPVRHEGRLLGFLWVLDPDGTVAETDLPALVDCAELAAEAMARSRQSAEDTRHLRDELVDRLLRAPDADAARDLARLEHLPHDARVQVEAPGKTGGWRLPDAMSAHVAGSRARTATSGSPLPLVELGEAVRPGPDVVSDRDIEAFIREKTGTSYHPSGTCRMGVDADAVVDGEARVQAVRGLRIADASIMPGVITGNLNAPVMMMAERISDRILGRAPLPPSGAPYYRAIAGPPP